MHDYLGCVKAVDEAVGKLLDYLDSAGLSENTLVLFSSDQGFYLGEHGWFDKRWIYEESLTTPCIVRWPGVTQPGTTSDAIVSILDFPETFLEAGQPFLPTCTEKPWPNTCGRSQRIGGKVFIIITMSFLEPTVSGNTTVL